MTIQFFPISFGIKVLKCTEDNQWPSVHCTVTVKTPYYACSFENCENIKQIRLTVYVVKTFKRIESMTEIRNL